MSAAQEIALAETLPGPGHLSSIEVLAAHAEAEATAKNNQVNLLSAGQRGLAGQLMAESRTARSAAAWLRALEARIRNGGAS